MVYNQLGIKVLVILSITNHGVWSIAGGLGDRCRENSICDDVETVCIVGKNVCMCRQEYEQQTGRCVLKATTPGTNQLNELHPNRDDQTNNNTLRQLLFNSRRNGDRNTTNDLLASGKDNFASKDNLISAGSINNGTLNKTEFDWSSRSAIQADNNLISIDQNTFRNFSAPDTKGGDSKMKELNANSIFNVSNADTLFNGLRVAKTNTSETGDITQDGETFKNPLLDNTRPNYDPDTELALSKEVRNDGSRQTGEWVEEGLRRTAGGFDAGSANIQTSSSGNSSERKLVCYYSSWALDRHGLGRFLPSDIDAHLCNYLIYEFVTIGNDFRLEMINSFADQYLYNTFNMLKLKNNSLKTMISLNGVKNIDGLIGTMMASGEQRMTFIDSCIRLLRFWGFDGLEIDLEFLLSQGTTTEDMSNFLKLLKELYEEFSKEANSSGWPQLFVSLAVTTKHIDVFSNQIMDKLDRYVHFVSLMLFDPREVNVTSIRGPLFQDFQNNVGYAESFLAKAGFTKSHICVGLPAYGRTFTLGETTNSSAASAPLQPGIQGNYTLQPGFLSFYEVCRFADTATSTRCRDPYTKEPYITSGNQLIAYEDTESLTYKINWIRDNNFGGASIWGLDLDDFQAMCRSSHQNFPLIRLLEQGLREHIVPPESGDGPCRPNNSSQKSTKTGTVEGNVVTNVTEKTQSLTNKPDFPAKVYKNDTAINNNEIIKSDQASLIASTTVVQKINTRLSILDLTTATGTTNSPISSVNINGKGKASNAKEFNGGTSPTDNNVSLPPSKAVGNPFVGTTTNIGTWGLQSDPVKADNKTSNKDTTSTVASSNQSSNLSFPLIANQVASDQLMPDSDIINNEQPVDATSDQNQVPSVDDTEVVDEDVQGNPGDDLNEDGVDIIE